MDLYSYLNEIKGKAYRDDKIKSYSLLRIYPQIDNSRKLKGNSRIIGDSEKTVQNTIIDMIISISARYLLDYKEIAYVLLTTKCESGFNPDAAAGTTSAAGLAQGTAAFISDAKQNSNKILGFTLDLDGLNIFDAEKGCYALIYSFILNRNKTLQYFNKNQPGYWTWLYILHHDGINSLDQYIDGKRKISKDGNDVAEYIIERLPIVEGLLKDNSVSTSFKLTTGDDTPVTNKQYVVTVSLSPNPLCPNTVSTLDNPLIFFKGKTDGEGKTEAINVLTGSEIIFTILRENYKKLAISENSNSAENKNKQSNEKPEESHKKEVNFKTYIVKSGDTLSAIAKSQGTSVDSLVNLNNLPDANILHIGQILKISYSLDNNPENNTKINYISRYVPEEVKQAIMKHLGVENSNTIAAISYSRSHIALPAGSTSADIDKNKNIVHIKTTTKPEAIRQRQKTSEKHKTDEKGTAKSALTPGKFEPIVIFSVSNKLQDLVTSKSLKILKEIMKNANIHKITITSTLRTAEKQADAMYANMQSKGIQSQLDYYSSAGREVIKSAIDAGGNDLDKIRQVKSAMVGKIVSLQNDGRLVSRHCVSEDMYATRNVFDISKHFSTKQSVQLAFDEALTNYAKNNDGFKYISPFIHRGEPAFHVEIEQ